MNLKPHLSAILGLVDIMVQNRTGVTRQANLIQALDDQARLAHHILKLCLGNCVSRDFPQKKPK